MPRIASLARKQDRKTEIKLESKLKSKLESKIEIFPLYLQVKCPKQNLGCLWQGELGTLEKHLDPVHGDCTADVPCKYSCGRKFPVGSLDDHYRTCDKRPYTCGHCLGFSSTYAEVTGVHCLTCPRCIRCYTEYKNNVNGLMIKLV